MKRLLLTVVAVACAAPAIAAAADLGANGTTMVRFSEQNTPGFDKKTLAPATQYLGLSATGLADGNLSLNFYGWGRVDLADQSTNEGKSDGTVSSAYLRYLFPKANGELKAGRFFLREGVARESLDGLLAAADLPAGFRLAVFGGAPSAISLEDDARGDWLAGSRLSLSLGGRSEIGVSYLQAGNSPTQEYSGGTLRTIRDRRELVGADIWLSPVQAITLNGQTTYNTVTAKVAEHDYNLAIRPLKYLTVTGNFSERQLKDLFVGTNMPFLFRPDANDKTTNYGGGIVIATGTPFSLAADYRHSKRDSYGTTNRFGGEVRYAAEKLFSGGIGYHRVESDAAPVIGPTTPLYDPSYHEARAWLLLDSGTYSASLNAIGNFYSDSTHPDLNGQKTLYEICASAGFRPAPYLKISGDVSYGETAFHTSEVKGLVRVEFNTSADSKGGSK